MDGNAYKQAKIDHVTGWTGSTVWDINQITLVAPAAALLWAVLQTRMRFFDPYTPVGYFADFLIHVCGILFATTVYADSPTVLIGLFTLPVLASYLNGSETDSKKPAKPPLKSEEKAPDAAENVALDYLPIKPFITTYRGAMLVITCIAILAVDFHVFPRRFAKVESWGTSLMDLGVGSFVFGAGVVSVRQQLKDAEDGAVRSTFLQRMNTAIMHSLPLLALGFIRLQAVKGLDYQEHVTEYGVHWNFFFTLGLLPPFVAIFQALFRLVPSYAILGFLICLPYEMSFWYSDTGHYIFAAPRTDFFSSNREGIYSFIGYLAIFLAGQGIGMEVLRRDVDALTPISENDEWVASMLGGEESLNEVRQQRAHNSLLKLAKWSAIWIAMYVLLTGPYGPHLTVSRRLANLPYVAWVAAFNTSQLLLFRLIEGFTFPNLYKARDRPTERERCAKATSKVLHAYNRNGLAVFVLANLLTGAVNLTTDTLSTNDVVAMVILVGYMGTLTGVALLLDHLNITIKL